MFPGVILTLPLVHFPTRRAVNFVLFPGQDFSWVKHIAVMVCLIGTCVILVISVPDIRDIFGFVGASSSGCLIFILPSLFYLKTKEGTIKGMGFEHFTHNFMIVSMLAKSQFTSTLGKWYKPDIRHTCQNGSPCFLHFRPLLFNFDAHRYDYLKDQLLSLL